METFNINTDDFSSVPDRPGIYFLIATDEFGKPQKIDRILQRDNGGLLYVGGAISLKKRIKQFRYSLTSKKKAHVAARRYCAIGNLSKKYSSKNFIIKYKTEKKNSYLQKEKKTLYDYILRFGETPPLNASSGIIRQILG